MPVPVQAKTRIDFLFEAEQAVNYVQKTMTVGAENKVGDELRSFGQSFLCVLAERTVNEEDEPATAEAFITRTAAIAESVGCGNCGEQSAVAFVYLRGRGIHPLEYMQFLNKDHAFVVLNRPTKSVVSKPETWGNDVVVCDPWKGRWYKSSALAVVWPGGIPLNVFRID